MNFFRFTFNIVMLSVLGNIVAILVPSLNARESASSTNGEAAAHFLSSPTLSTSTASSEPSPTNASELLLTNSTNTAEVVSNSPPPIPAATAVLAPTPATTPQISPTPLTIATTTASTNTTLTIAASPTPLASPPFVGSNSAAFAALPQPTNLPPPPNTNPATIGKASSAQYAQTGGVFTALAEQQHKKVVPISAESLMKAGEKIDTGVIAPGAKRLSLDECVRTALQKNPTVITAIESIRQQSGNFITIRAALLPQVGITNGAYQWQDPKLNNPQNLPSNEVPINQTWGLTAGVSQLLYNGGTAIANMKAAKLSEQMAYYQLRATIDSVIAQVISNFYQVILNRALVVANMESVELLASQLKDQQTRYDAGTVPFFNVIQAQVQLVNAQPLLITARNNLRLSLFQLVQLIGMNYPNLQSVAVPFDVMGELAYHPRKINSNESIYTALQRSPTLKVQRQNILVMAQNISSALGGYLPTITATGGRQYVSSDRASVDASGDTVYNHNIANFVNGWFFGIQGNWAIFDGLATYGSVKQAKANLMIAKTNYDNGVRQVILTVQQAISNMQQAQETVDSQKANVTQAAEALRLSQERLDSGAGVQLDVLNGQIQLLLTQTTVLQSEYNYIAATAQYDQALSLNTQYEELFDDPMNHRERDRYKVLNSNKNSQPLLPRALRSTDPLPTAFTAVKKTSKASAKPKSSPSPKVPNVSEATQYSRLN